MKNLVAVMILSMGLCLGANAGPIIVGNGTGLGEFNVLYAQKNWPSLLSLCEAKVRCHSGIETSLSAMRNLPLEMSLDFQTTSDMGTTLFDFSLDLQRLRINKDLLFANGRPWDFVRAVEFWVLVANRLSPFANLDTVLIRFQDLAGAQYSRSRNIESWAGDFNALLFESPQATLVFETFFDGQPAAAYEVPFPTSLNCELSTGVASPVVSLQVRSTRWARTSFHDPKLVRATVVGSMTYECLDQSTHQLVTFESQYFVHVSVGKDSAGRYALDPNSIEIIQDRIRRVPSAATL